MPVAYSVIEIYTSEEARHDNRPLSEAVPQYVHDRKIAARCLVFRGRGGCYENGDIATPNVLELSYNLPVKIEILLPAAEVEQLLPTLETMVADGIIAVRDLALRRHRTRQRLFPRQTTVRDVMTPSPTTVRADTPVSEVVRLLLSSIFSGLPVVDAANRPIGIISQGDLIYRANLPLRPGLLAASDASSVQPLLNGLADMPAESIMTHPPITIEVDALLTRAVDRMLAKKVKRLPVTDAQGRLVGMLSRLDIFQTISRKAPDWDRLQAQQVEVANRQKVADVMRRDTQTVRPETSVEEVIRIIDSDDIQRVAVVDDQNRLLGLISDHDLLAAFADDQPGIWTFLARKLPFSEKGRRQAAFQNRIREKSAADVMIPHPVTVSEETRLEAAIGLMTAKGLKRLPVVDTEGRFRGMLSRDALLRTGFGQG